MREARQWMARGNRERNRGNLTMASFWYSKAGHAFAVNGVFDAAVDAYQRAAKFYQTDPHTYYQAGWMYLAIADLCRHHARFGMAVAFYDRAWILFSNVPGESGMAQAVLDKKIGTTGEAIGTEDPTEGYRRSIALFKEVAEEHAAASEEAMEGWARLSVADGYFHLGEYDSAEREYNQAMALLFAEEKYLEAADAFQRRVVQLEATDLSRSAVAGLYQRAGIAYQRGNRDAEAAKMHRESAALFYKDKEYLLAAQEWGMAAEYFRSAGQSDAALDADKQRAYAFEKGGQPAEAIRLLKGVAEEAESSGDKERAANAYFGLGMVLLKRRRGMGVQAANAFAKIYRLRLEQGHDGNAAIASAFQSAALRNAGKRVEANRSWEIALVLAKGERKLLTGMGSVYEAWDLLDLALTTYSRVLESLRPLEHEAAAIAQENIGRVLVKKGELRRALHLYENAKHRYGFLKRGEEVERMKKAIREINAIQ